MIIEKKRGTAVARNRGINEARYDFVAFIDADCEAPPDWLNILSEKYLKSVKNDHHIIGVGGKNIPPQNADNFVKAIGIALDNYIGSFNSSHGRQFPEERYILSPSNLNVLYQKQPLIDIGGYDETLKSEAEDADINYRLTIEGYRFMYIPESYVWHKMRPTPSSWFKNMFRYGKGRARLLKRHRGMWQISFVLPIIFLFAFSGLIFIPLSKIFCVCLLYFPIVVVISLRQVLLKKVPQLWIHTICVYIIQHFGYAMGECFGLISPRVR